MSHPIHGAATWLRRYIGHVNSVSVGIDHAFAVTDKELAAVCLEDGSVDWRREIAPRQAVRVHERIITISDSVISSWHSSSGQKLWEVGIAPSSASSICARGDSTYIVSRGHVSALTSAGTLKWRSGVLAQEMISSLCAVYNGTIRVGVAVSLDGASRVLHATFDSQTGSLISRSSIASAEQLVPHPTASPDLQSQMAALTQTELWVLSHDFSSVCVLGESSVSLACAPLPMDASEILNAHVQATPTGILLSVSTRTSGAFFSVLPGTWPLLRQWPKQISAVSSAYLLRGRSVRMAVEKIRNDGVLRIVTLDADTGDPIGESQEVADYPAVHVGRVASQPTSIWISEGAEDVFECTCANSFPCTLCSMPFGVLKDVNRSCKGCK